MSKSKLNKRQLKKISKLAMDAVVNFQGVGNLPEFSFCKESGEHFFWYSTYFGECDESTSSETLSHFFANEWDFMTGALFEDERNPSHRYPDEYYSLSFANRIHYMAKYLEG